MTSPLWIPSHPKASRLWHFMRFVENTQALQFKTYAQLHAWSIKQPALFWQTLCDFFEIRFDTPAHTILSNDATMMDARWFVGAHLNVAAHLLSRDDEHPALISVNESDHREVLSYRTLRQQVAACAAGLKAAGIEIGDRVGAILPNTPYALIAMLATASIGAIWASCSPEFGAEAIIDRLGQIEPKLLFVTDGHVYQGNRHEAGALLQILSQQIPSVQTMVLCSVIKAPLTLEKGIPWDAFQKPAIPLTFTSLPFDHPLYILFSSGTTGRPKCLIHSAGGTLLQHIKELGLHTNITPNDNLCFYTTCGWMMWNWMASTLALGATLTLYDGSPTFPDATRLFRLIDEEKITVFGTSAKFISTLTQSGLSPKRTCALTSLKTLLSTGSPLLPKHYEFVYDHIKSDIQLSSMSGGTDIISCFALGNPLLPVYEGELQCIGLGMNVAIYDEAGVPVLGTRGELVCTNPFPSMPIGFWNDPTRSAYQRAYFERFPGVWAQGDFAEITAHQGVIIYGRSDTTLNPGGVRMGTAEIYRQLETIPEIVDSVVIGQDWQDDVRIVLFVILRDGLALTEDLQTRIRQTLRRQASPRHVPAKILQVQDIPRTLNGKVVELAVRQTVQGQTVTNQASLANPEALAEFKNREALQT